MSLISCFVYIFIFCISFPKISNNSVTDIHSVFKIKLPNCEKTYDLRQSFSLYCNVHLNIFETLISPK